MDSIVSNYRTFVGKLEADIIQWARPEGWSAGPTSVCFSLNCYTIIIHLFLIGTLAMAFRKIRICFIGSNMLPPLCFFWTGLNLFYFLKAL